MKKTKEKLSSIGRGILRGLVYVVIFVFLLAAGPGLTLCGLALMFQSIHVAIDDPHPRTLVLDYGSYEYKSFGKLELPQHEEATLVDLRDNYKLLLMECHKGVMVQLGARVQLLFMNKGGGCSEVKTIPSEDIFKKQRKFWPLEEQNILFKEVDALPGEDHQVTLRFQAGDSSSLIVFFIFGLISFAVGILFDYIILGVSRDNSI